MSLPGADELFRTTGGTGLQPSSPRRQANPEAGPRVPGPAGESGSGPETGGAGQEGAAGPGGRGPAATDRDPAAERRTAAQGAAG
ncbi:hypothetical protein CK936_02680, partial [Streptomyces albireticuli]